MEGRSSSKSLTGIVGAVAEMDDGPLAPDIRTKVLAVLPEDLRWITESFLNRKDR
ncbi:MAG: hypothetical protein SWC40_03370 [Thermodesulfobacteriota bacterium]|nr:hypothetical protein [Thermodesulfobacteriota bacterium]